MPFESFTKFLSFLTLLSDILILVLLASYFLKKNNLLSDWIGEKALSLSYVVALGSVLLSLFYSNIADFLPCTLCWWQRIFLYPQVIILGYGLWKKDEKAADYAMLLSIIGGAIALYHTYLQFGGSPLVPCAADGSSNCSLRYFVEFGYITIPTMSLTSFGLIISFLLARKGLKSERPVG